MPELDEYYAEGMLPTKQGWGALIELVKRAAMRSDSCEQKLDALKEQMNHMEFRIFGTVNCGEKP